MSIFFYFNKNRFSNGSATILKNAKSLLIRGKYLIIISSFHTYLRYESRVAVFFEEEANQEIN